MPIVRQRQESGLAHSGFIPTRWDLGPLDCSLRAFRRER
jgi:hypothetical protein